MNDLRDLLRDGAPSVGSPDLTTIRERSVKFQRRRRRSQLGVAIAAVALVSGGALVSLSGNDDSARVIADQPAPAPAEERESPGPSTSIDADVRIETEVEGGTESNGTGQAEVGAESSVGANSTDGDAPAPPNAEPEEEPRNDPNAAPERRLRFEDPAGDTSSDPRVGTQTRSPEPQLDILAGELIATSETLTIVTTLGELETSGPPGANGGYYQTSFDYTTDGTTARIVVDIQRYNGTDFIRLDVQTEATARYDGCQGCRVSFDTSRNTVTGVVPFEDLERALTAAGVAQGPDAVASAVVMKTGWVNSTSTAADCKDPGDLRSVCAGYSGAGADVAMTPEALRVR